MAKLPLIVTDPDPAHRHLQTAHPSAKIVSQTLQVVNDASMVPTVINDLLRRGKTEHPDALETVVIVSKMYDDKHNVIAGVAAVALAHALP